MDRKVATIGIVVCLIFAGCTASPSGGSDVTSTTTTEMTNTESGLISQEEAIAATDTEPSNATATLYFVAENGTWYHASPDKSIGQPAPNGSETVVGNTTLSFNESERPLYIWKVTRPADMGGKSRHGAATYAVNAETGEVISKVLAP